MRVKKAYRIPYGKGHLDFELPDDLEVDVVAMPETDAAPDPVAAVEAALAAPVGGVDLERFRDARSAAIAVSDKTRPVPHRYLLPPLLRRLEGLGLSPEAILLLIATGTHAPMPPDEYGLVLPEEVLARYPVVSHDADDRAALEHLGTTSRSTPVWANRRYLQADLRIVVGNIEPHQFQGFSGGVKSAAIGLAGRDTVNCNHAMLSDPLAQLGRYDDNPMRQDVEEIGRKIGVHFALNAVLNDRKEIINVLAGEPVAVMRAGIPLSRQVSQVTVSAPFDLVIASPGGHPKDINLYQSQKALRHASQVAREGGVVILVAACPEGVGSEGYEAWMADVHSHDEVFTRFEREGFQVGPHKALLISQDSVHRRVYLVSEMSPDLVRGMLLTPADDLEAALAAGLAELPEGGRVGIVPRASSTIPCVTRSTGS
jgi:nickel-dependent lactate racemase